MNAAVKYLKGRYAPLLVRPIKTLASDAGSVGFVGRGTIGIFSVGRKFTPALDEKDVLLEYVDTSARVNQSQAMQLELEGKPSASCRRARVFSKTRYG